PTPPTSTPLPYTTLFRSEPRRALLRDDRARDRVHAAGDPLAHDHDVGLDPRLGDAPHLPGPHQARLHLVGDVERAVALAQRLDRDRKSTRLNSSHVAISY